MEENDWLGKQRFWVSIHLIGLIFTWFFVDQCMNACLTFLCVKLTALLLVYFMGARRSSLVTMKWLALSSKVLTVIIGITLEYVTGNRNEFRSFSDIIGSIGRELLPGAEALQHNMKQLFIEAQCALRNSRT